MPKQISDERLAELIAEEKRIAESRADEALEVEWAKDVLAALHELAEYRKREAESTVEWGAREPSIGVHHEGSRERAQKIVDQLYSGTLVRRTVGPWVEVTDGE